MRTTVLSISRISTIAVLFFLGLSKTAYAQLPVCAGDSGLVYAVSGTSLYNWNPYIPLSATNPSLNTITLPSTAAMYGLAVSANLNSGAGPSPTFYTVGFSDSKYYYYDGATWVNTGHDAGTAAFNIGAGGGYIYNLNGSGSVYRYDGSGNALLVTTVTDFNLGGPLDMVADCEGNFYLLKCGSSGWLRKYNPSGVLLYQWNVTGAPAVVNAQGFGLAIMENLLLFYTNQLYAGIIDPAAASIPVNPISGSFPAVNDFGSCPVGGIIAPANDTIFNCMTGITDTIKAAGIAPFSYSIINGSATVTGTGPEFFVTNNNAAPATVVLHSNRNALYCGTGPVEDTFLIVPAPVADAGADDTLTGCTGLYMDTLHGIITNALPWVGYTYYWPPAGAFIVSGGNTPDPVVQVPTGSTAFSLVVTTGALQGGCTVTDTVRLYTSNEAVSSGYTYSIRPGCTSDTVIFTNTSVNHTTSQWVFGDGQTDTAQHPVHVYAQQGSYVATLTASNALCSDTALKIINTDHPLIASFQPDKDTICQNTLVAFSNNSTVTLLPGSFLWPLATEERQLSATLRITMLYRANTR